MAIDFSAETPLSIAEAAAIIPGRPSLASVWRWVLKGVRGNQLESLMIAGRRFTSHEAIDRFIQRSNSTPSLPAIVTATRRREIAAATSYCEAAGI
ncbi:MAG: DUF1580 domain-containing protein [Planctomycetia bacterium]|nr:DUF1580 domain-containing protein [Planctomycetia bacterium]